jgi:hypothetical protein
MKVLAWVSDGKKRERVLADALVAGAQQHGDIDAEIRIKGLHDHIEDCDLACLVGVKNIEMFRAYRKRGINCLYCDKGYIRRLAEETDRNAEWLTYWRVAVNAHQPITFVAKAKRSYKRAERAGMRLEPWRERGEAILVDGSSAKHYAFHDLGNPTEVAKELIDRVKAITDRPIIYRPKPSWHGAVPIEGTEYSNGKDFRTAFARTHALITYGSNLCYDAVLAGVPSIVLGEGIARPISSTALDAVECPRLATSDERKQWVSNVAWCQFELPEFKNGLAWDTIKEMITCATE